MVDTEKNILLVGGFNPSEKYESQLGSVFPIYIWKNKIHVLNHQPAYVYTYSTYPWSKKREERELKNGKLKRKIIPFSKLT